MGVEVSEGVNYLPDFYLTDHNMWVEIKFEPLKHFDFQRCVDLVIKTQTPLVILDGDPGFKSYAVIRPIKNSYEVKHINLLTDNSGALVESGFLYDPNNFPKNVKEAVNSSRSHRFGVYES